jgi:hypothetical protein
MEFACVSTLLQQQLRPNEMCSEVILPYGVSGRPTCSYRMQFGQYVSTAGTFRPRSSKSLNGRPDFTVTSAIISQFQCLYIALLFPKCFLLCSWRISYPFVLMIRLPVIHSRYTNIEGPYEGHRWTDITWWLDQKDEIGKSCSMYGERRNAYRIVVEKSEIKKTLAWQRRKRQDTIAIRAKTG